MRQAEHVARMQKSEVWTIFLLDNLNGRDYFWAVGVDGRD
jgi:hypothetical protein